MSKSKEIQLNLIDVIKDFIEEDPEKFLYLVVQEYVKKEIFPREEIRLLLKDSFKEKLNTKIVELGGYLENDYNLFFTDNLTTLYRECLKEYLTNNKVLNKKIIKFIKDYFEGMNFEKTIMEFIDQQKEMIMEAMFKKMFNK